MFFRFNLIKILKPTKWSKVLLISGSARQFLIIILLRPL